MSKRKFGFEGFGINRQATYNFERSQAPQRLYVPPSSRQNHDNYEDTDLDNIDYDDNDAAKESTENNGSAAEIDPLDAFMEGIHEEMRAAPPPKAKEKVERYKDDDDEEDDPMESFLRAKKDLGLTLAADALNAGYDSDEEVYAAAKAVDAGMLEYDSDDNPVVIDKKKIEPIPALDHSSIEYEPFSKDFYEESPSISEMSEQDVAEYRKSLAIRVSATMPRKIEKLAREILTDPVRVTVGEVGMANEDITQVVQVIPSDAEKLPWLIEKLPGMIDEGDVLVFASKKATVDDIESQLALKAFKVAALHGDKDQASRMEILQKFKSGVYHVLVATDVAARGLDIKSIKSVVNFDIARDMDAHVHRIGRTGRAGDKDGIAYTLVTQKEARFAGELVNSLIAAGQNASVELMELAMKDGRFRSKRDSRKGGGKKGKGRGGGNRGVRGVDFGLGIGYNPESNSISSPAVTSRSVAVNSLRTGVMAQFKSNFVAATSQGPGPGPGVNTSSSVYANKRPALRGFVSGGSIGGDMSRSQTTSSLPGFVSGGSIGVDMDRPQTTSSLPGFVSGSSIGGDATRNQTASQNSGGNTSQKNTEGSRDRGRERRRPSGWDR
ncbi:ATP-DEPENDENT RNA HELICASE DBP3 [Salix purpurea]|uniref:ATP-DEPENDENT RNA HELICASE DBP3 n=1 Tax=Salix purpurea TaxID=77065 RepID=A0A9Q0SR71_SALPP|nr:ATP-DEPENDENT RNA HELICASE DBP3 [Salix purpurea]